MTEYLDIRASESIRKILQANKEPKTDDLAAQLRRIINGSGADMYEKLAAVNRILIDGMDAGLRAKPQACIPEAIADIIERSVPMVYENDFKRKQQNEHDNQD